MKSILGQEKLQFMCIIKHNEINFNSCILEKVEITVSFQAAIHVLLYLFIYFSLPFPFSITGRVWRILISVLKTMDAKKKWGQVEILLSSYLHPLSYLQKHIIREVSEDNQISCYCLSLYKTRQASVRFAPTGITLVSVLPYHISDI